MSGAEPLHLDPPGVDDIVSVIVTTMNRYDECRRCLESVLAQSHPNLDIIVVEDGGDSGIADYVAEKNLPNLRYLGHTEQRGLSVSRNDGIAAAKGRFVAFLDDDDAWKPERIAAQIAYWRGLPSPAADRVAMVYCGAEIRNAANRRVGEAPPTNRGPLKQVFVAGGFRTVPSSYLFHRDAIEALGGFDENLRSSIDHDMWMAMAAADLSIEYVPDPLVITYERIGRDTMMTRTAERIQGVTAFVDKWRDTWTEWFGDNGRYAERYFEKVISSLAADHAAQGRYDEVARACGVALRHSSQPVRCSLRLSARVLRGTARGVRAQFRRMLPARSAG